MSASLYLSLLVSLAPANGVPAAAALPVPATGFAATSTPPAPLRHTELQATFPAADSVHRGPVEEIRLRYSTAVQLGLSTVSLRGPAGSVAAEALALAPGSDDQELLLPLTEPLTSGEYTVEWTTAGPDGHPLSGQLSFTVDWDPPSQEPATDTADAAASAGEPTALTPTSQTGEAAGGGAAGALARWLTYLALAGALGTSAFRAGVLRRVRGEGLLAPAVDTARSRVTLLAWVAALAGVVGLPTSLGVQSIQLFGSGGLAPGSLSRVLTSAWGLAWWVQAAGLALFLVGLGIARGSRPSAGWGVVGLAGVLLAAGSASAGHAAEGGAAWIAVQAVHASAAGIWVGGLVCLVVGGLGGARKVPPALPRFVNAFSPMALAAVTVMILTGVLNAWDRLGSPVDLFTTSYGRVLALKLALVAGAAALGFHNWRTVRPALQEEVRPGLLRLPATLEFTLGLAVLLVTAVLVVLPMPG